MGNCKSSNTDNVVVVQGSPIRNHERQWSDRGRVPANNRSTLQSMARVGSRVFKQTSMDADIEAAGTSHSQNDDVFDIGNKQQQQVKRTTLTEHKASTYEHVHEMVQESIDSIHHQQTSKAKAGRVGLTNLGNTCFMNSSLQCLSNTIPLSDYVLGYDYRSEINHDNFLGTQGQLVSSYAELIKHLWLGSNSYYNPSSFKNILSKFAPQFEGYEQQDSQELLSYLLDGIHEDLNRVKKKPYIEEKDCDGTNDEGDAITSWSNYLQRNQSIIVDMFQGQLRSTITCRNQQCKQQSSGIDGSSLYGCGHINVKFDPFMYLSLPISDNCNTLDDCLDLYCEEELLVGDEQWYCPKCKTHVDATKKIDLFMLPPILIIHLKRFKVSSYGGNRSKITKSIQYPLNDWNLSKQKKSSSGIYPLYDCYAISQHHGSVGYGHYTAHAKNRFDGMWYNFNDSIVNGPVVNPRSEGLGSGSSAYCLFYNRVERVDSYRGGGGNRKKCIEKKTVIRRQSISRPELWPHLQREKVTEWKSVRINDYVWNEDDSDDDNEEKIQIGLGRVTE